MRISTAGTADSAYALDRHLLGRMPSGRILNLGAGRGASVEGRQVINVDHVAPARRAPVMYVVGDAADLPFRDGVFDGALLKDVIEHLADPIGALAESSRVLRRGAPMTVEVPRAIPRAVWADPTHVRGFTSRSLETAMRTAGLVPTRPLRMGGFPGAGRLGLIPWLPHIMRIPGLGHWFGTNWLVTGSASRVAPGGDGSR